MRTMYFALTGILLSAAVFAADLKSPDACTLVTKQDAQRILGEELSEPEANTTEVSDTVKLTDCTYESSDGDKVITLTLRVSHPGDNDPIAMVKAMKEGDSEIEDVSGVGDVAIWKSPDNFQAFKGKDVQVIVSIINFPSAKDKAIALAKFTLEMLASPNKAEAEN